MIQNPSVYWRNAIQISKVKENYLQIHRRFIADSDDSPVQSIHFCMIFQGPHILIIMHPRDVLLWPEFGQKCAMTGHVKCDLHLN